MEEGGAQGGFGYLQALGARGLKGEGVDDHEAEDGLGGGRPRQAHLRGEVGG